MDDIRAIRFPLWIAAGWAAFFFRPAKLNAGPEAGGSLKRLATAFLCVLYCITVASAVVVLAVAAVGFVGGLAR